MLRVAACLLLASACHAQVRFTHESDRVRVIIDGRPFGSLYFGKETNKPFFHPLTTASGKKVTRSFPLEQLPGEPTDHPHQKGLWIGAEHLSGMDFWENDPSYKRPRMGKILFQDITRMVPGDTGVLAFTSDWISPEGATVMSELCSLTFYSGDKSIRMLDVDVTLKAHENVEFEDHHDAVIGIRLAPAFEEARGGKPVNAEGATGEAGTRGKASRFLDWQTTLDGEKVGVALFDHPSNVHSPARWHVRSMGLMTANPFARQTFDPKAASAALPLRRGETLRLRYRLLIHPADHDLEATFRNFAAKQ